MYNSYIYIYIYIYTYIHMYSCVNAYLQSRRLALQLQGRAGGPRGVHVIVLVLGGIIM